MKSEADAVIEIIIEIAIKILIIFTCLYFENVFIYVAYAIYSIGFLCFCMLPSHLNIGYIKLIVYLIWSIKIGQKLIELVIWFSFKWFINNDEQFLSKCIFYLFVSNAIEIFGLYTVIFDLLPNHVGFICKSKIGSSRCALTYTDKVSLCFKSNLKHLVECHSRNFGPMRNIGVYKTTLISAIEISSSGFTKDLIETPEGMLDAGIYFTPFDHSLGKASINEPLVLVIAQVDAEKQYILKKSETLEKLTNKDKAEVDLDQPEFFILEPDAVLKWIICL